MKIKIIAVGKLNDNNLKAILNEYQKRIKNITITEIATKNSYKETDQQAQKIQYKEIIKNISPQDIVVSMDENGEQFNSKNFAKFLLGTSEKFGKTISFVIGGAPGLDSRIISQSYKTISLSKMTLPHMLARVFLIEQIYRSQSINQGHPYHK